MCHVLCVTPGCVWGVQEVGTLISEAEKEALVLSECFQEMEVLGASGRRERRWSEMETGMAGEVGECSL